MFWRREKDFTQLLEEEEELLKVLSLCFDWMDSSVRPSVTRTAASSARVQDVHRSAARRPTQQMVGNGR